MKKRYNINIKVWMDNLQKKNLHKNEHNFVILCAYRFTVTRSMNKNDKVNLKNKQQVDESMKHLTFKANCYLIITLC